MSLLRYGLVGALGTAVHLSLLAFAVECGGWPPLAATSLGFSGALVFSYLLNRRWTFQSRREHEQGAWRYLSVSLLGLGINAALMSWLVEVWGLWYFGAQCVVIFVVPVLNYGLNRHWTFPKSQP